VLISTLYC